VGTSIERIYRDLFGDKLLREGEALERIAAIVSKILSAQADVQHDARIRGNISKSLYQLDIEERTTSGFTAGEAKDYEQRESPVGRPDIQKFAAALPDIGANSGRFFASTRFTKPARLYANAADKIIGRPIELSVLRAFGEKDLDGRITRIILQFHIAYPDWNSPGSLLPRLSEAASVKLRSAFGPDVKNGDTFQVGVDTFFDAKGNQISSVSEITRELCGEVDHSQSKMIGYLPRAGHHLLVNNTLIEIEGFDYNAPVVTDIEKVIIESSENPSVTHCDGTGKVKHVFTKEQLRRFHFSDDGTITD
jgi:hypothetical protein